jgi:plastocyanin
MRKLLLLALVPFALAFAGPAVAATPVTITTNGFEPAQVSVGAGDEVTWKNTDTARRQLVADGGAFSSPSLAPGESWTFRFPSAGTFTYHDGLKTTQKGTVTVRRTGVRSVTIASTQRQITLGSSVELSGNVTGAPRAGQQVVVVAKPYQGTETRTTAITDSDGTWSLRVRPRIRTEYSAESGNIVSTQSPIVYVRPAVALRVLNARLGRFYTKVTALRSYRGKFVTIQRLTAGGTWAKVRRVRLAAGSAARFTARLPRTARVRVLVPSAPGYLQGFSRTALVRR